MPRRTSFDFRFVLVQRLLTVERFPAIWGQRLCFNLKDAYIDFAPCDFEPWRQRGEFAHFSSGLI